MITQKPRVLLISPAHPSADPRIVLKTAPTLARHYNVVCLLPSAEHPDQHKSIVRFVSLPRQKHLWIRLLVVHPVILWHIACLRPAIVHLFMPELLPIGLLCQLFGVRVVYEVQENLRLKFNRKTHNKHPAFQWFFRKFEQLARRFCYHIFTENSYLATYNNLRLPFAVVQNFPDVAGMCLPEPRINESQSQTRVANQAAFAYVGLVSFDRGLGAMVRAMALVNLDYPDVKLHLIGRCNFNQADLKAMSAFALVRDNLVFHGHRPHTEALPIVAQCRAGLALLQPVGDYPYSYPTKLFEYMALGLPVVVSDFPLYRSIVESADCGFCVNPDDHYAIADALTMLITHADESARMGALGRRAVSDHYTWATESEKLIDLYQKIVL